MGFGADSAGKKRSLDNSIFCCYCTFMLGKQRYIILDMSVPEEYSEYEEDFDEAFFYVVQHYRNLCK